MFSDLDFRTMLLLCHTEEEFKLVLEEHTRAMMERMSHIDEKIPSFDSDNVSHGNSEGWVEQICWILTMSRNLRLEILNSG